MRSHNCFTSGGDGNIVSSDCHYDADSTGSAKITCFLQFICHMYMFPFTTERHTRSISRKFCCCSSGIAPPNSCSEMWVTQSQRRPLLPEQRGVDSISALYVFPLKGCFGLRILKIQHALNSTLNMQLCFTVR